MYEVFLDALIIETKIFAKAQSSSLLSALEICDQQDIVALPKVLPQQQTESAWRNQILGMFFFLFSYKVIQV